MSCTGAEPVDQTVWVQAEERSVAETLRVTGIVTHPLVGSVLVADGGRVTSEFARDVLGPGDVVAQIDGRSLVVAVTAQPFYRTMSLGTKGADVAALRAALEDLGFASSGASLETFNTSLRNAVRDWQASTNSVVDGVVRVSDLSGCDFPCRVDSEFGLADVVAAGTTIDLRSTVGQVEVTIRPDQVALLSVGQSAELTTPSGEVVEASIAAIDDVAVQLEDGVTRFVARLDVPEDVVLLEGSTASVAIVVADHGTGVAVPAAALVASASGGWGVFVPGADGPQLQDVEVVGSDGVWTLVEGDVSVGTDVVLRDDAS